MGGFPKLLGLIVVVGGVLGALYIYYGSQQRIDPRVAHCYAPLGKKVALGIKISETDKSFSFDNLDEVQRAIDPITLAEFTKCVEISLSAIAKLPSDAERISAPVPLGMAINNWITAGNASTSKLNVALNPLDDPQLNNLLVDPSMGTRWSIVKQWCEKSGMTKCIDCSSNIDESTTSLIITKKKDGVFKKVDFERAGVAPPTGEKRPAWELIEGDRRMAYQCGG